MAPIPPNHMDLAKYLTGEHQLITWEAAYNALCDPETAAKSEPLREFLQAEENVAILSSPWAPFPQPSAQEKTKFDSATAPISISPAQTEHYNLDEIREDSLWLSKEAQISEHAALRLAVQEWQTRPAVQLLSGFTEEEVLSVREAAGVNNPGASAFLPNLSIIKDPLTTGDRTSAQFDSSDQRRLRLIGIYFSTCASILRVSQMLTAWGAARDLRTNNLEYPSTYRVCNDHFEELGATIATKQNDPTSTRSRAPGLDRCILAVKAKDEALNKGCTWDVPESIQGEVDAQWILGQTTQLLHILHLALFHADVNAKTLLPVSTVDLWIQTFSALGFYQNFPSLHQGQGPLIPLIQALVSTISVAILKPNVIIDDFDSEAYTDWDRHVYVHDGPLLERISAHLFDAADRGPGPGLPAAFAWASILWRLHMHLHGVEEARAESLDAEPPIGLSNPRRSQLEEALIHHARLESNEAPIFLRLAEACVGQNIFIVMGTLLGVGMDHLGSKIDRVSRDRFRLLYLHVIRAALSGRGIEFTAEGLVDFMHQVLIGDRLQQDWITRGGRHADPIVTFFRSDVILRTELLDPAKVHYPLEIQPLLLFSSALVRGEGARGFYDDLTRMGSVTQRLPVNFNDFRLEQEEMNENRVALETELLQFITPSKSSLPNRRRLLASNANQQEQKQEMPLTIPAETLGVILDESEQPYIARWVYHHSALDYFYHLLSTYAVGSTRVVNATRAPVSTEDAARIIELFADTMHATLQDGDECPVDVLSALSIGPENSPDTVSIVLSIFEEELLRQYQDPSNELSLHLLVTCTYFLQALIKVAPNRVWPWIARSRLLASDGNGGSLASILIGTEMVLGSYKFLIGCVQLFQGLVANAVGASVSRKSTTSNQGLTRFNASPAFESGTSEKAMSTALLTFGKMLASVYDTSLSWKYKDPEDRLRINVGICEAFSDILRVAYDVDDARISTGTLSSTIAPIADYITDLYLTRSKKNLPPNPILSSLLSGTDLVQSTIIRNTTVLSQQQTKSTLVFSEMLIRVAILLDRPWTHLEQQLFKSTPLLARLFVTSEVWKAQVVALLETLVRAAVRIVEEPSQKEEDLKNGREVQGKEEEDTTEERRAEPPSLLGHLGPRTAKNFMMVVSQLDGPLKIVDIQESVWNLLTAVITCKQRWCALYLLTGSTPREMVRSKSKTTTGSSSNRSLLSRALDALSHLDLDMIDPPWSLWTAMLQFVTSAQNHWSWALSDLREQKIFIQQLVKFLNWMSMQAPPVADIAVTHRAYANKFTSLVIEILAMYLHTSRQAGDDTTFKDISNGLSYLQENALKAPEYNSAQHSGLKSSFETIFRGVQLASLKHTTLYPQPYGDQFYYDIKFASRLLNHHRSWNGPGDENRNGQNTNFPDEMARANRNLSLVDSQVKLLHGWKLLALELSHFASKSPQITKSLIGVVRDCMKANADLSLPEALFGQLMVLRADLAFAVLKKLVEDKVRSVEARQLLIPVWLALRAPIQDFDDVFASEIADYYRSLLRILYLTLHFYLISPSDQADLRESTFRSSFRGSLVKPTEDGPEVNLSAQLLEILSDTVAKGFRSLATQLHADPTAVSPSDFALLTALLQRLIVIPEMATSQSQIALLFANSNTLRYATALFSWSDRLLLDTSGSGTPDDPLYGELALLFLVALSSNRALAETMAVDGVLAQINAANLMNYFRRPGGMGPFTRPVRMHSIWTKGILPLCLNLLVAVGEPLAGEISSFLNAYPEQLSRSSNALNERQANLRITANLAAETHSLALLDRIIEEVKNAGIAAGVQPGEVSSLEWDRENVKEDLEGWFRRPNALREVVVGDGMKGSEDRVIDDLVAAGNCLGIGGNGK